MTSDVAGMARCCPNEALEPPLLMEVEDDEAGGPIGVTSDGCFDGDGVTPLFAALSLGWSSALPFAIGEEELAACEAGEKSEAGRSSTLIRFESLLVIPNFLEEEVAEDAEAAAGVGREALVADFVDLDLDRPFFSLFMVFLSDTAEYCEVEVPWRLN